MDTENKEGLPAVAWGDPEGKGMMQRISEIEFDDDFSKSRDIQIPAMKSSEPEKAPEKTKELAPEKSEKKQSEEPKAEESTPLIDEDFFGGLEPEKKTEEEVKEVQGFDENAFDAETEEQAKGLDKKAGEKFKALRGELKELKAKSAEPVIPEDTKKELETLRIKAEEVEGLKKRMEELASISAKTKMEMSEEYDLQVVKPAAQLFERAEELSKIYNLEPQVLNAIIKEGDRKRQNELISEHLSEFSDFDRNEAYRMIQDFKGLVSKRKVMLADAETLLERQEAQRMEEQKRLLDEQRTSVQRIQKDIWDKYKETIPGLVEDGVETKALKDLRSKSLSIDFSTSRAKDQAFAAFAGTVLPHVVRELAALRKELADRDRAEGKEVSSRPKPGESLKAAPPVSNEAPKSFMERLASAEFA